MKKIGIVHYSKTGNCQALFDEGGSKLRFNIIAIMDLKKNIGNGPTPLNL